MLSRGESDFHTEIGVGALHDASPLSQVEIEVRTEIVSGVDKLLTATFLARCAKCPDDVRWLLDLFAAAKDRVESALNMF
mgnify:CR=1 FL=1